MFISSLALFSLLALGASFARTPITLDILMGIQGLVTASAVPPAQGMLSLIYDRPSKRKNAAFACFSAGNPLGFVAGMIAGGIAAGIAGWRASFWFLAMLYAVFTVVALFNVPPDPSPKEKWTSQTWKKLDVVGNLLALAGIGFFSSALRYIVLFLHHV
jgi:MFS family permease